MQLAANLGAGNADFNQPRFRLYRDNLDSIRSWTTLRMGMRPGICVPETMRFDGTGWYTGTDEGNPSCTRRRRRRPGTSATSPPAPRSA